MPVTETIKKNVTRYSAISKLVFEYEASCYTNWPHRRLWESAL